MLPIGYVVAFYVCAAFSVAHNLIVGCLTWESRATEGKHRLHPTASDP